MKGHWFQTVIDSIAERGRELLGLQHDAVNKRQLLDLCQQLLRGQGEASGIALSQEILYVYNSFSKEEKLRFFKLLAEQFDPDLQAMQSAMTKYLESRSAQSLVELTNAIEAPRQELFRRLNLAPGGTAKLVGLRADLLRCIKDHPELIAVDADLKHILSSWFNRGFLQLRNIDWQSPAHILEKLINYESVHEIHGWDDLRRRLMQDRRCFAFFHPAMPDEPLIFIEVALVKGLSSVVTGLLDPHAPVLDPKQADTAIFYSINNTQTGLRGISFGNFLIKRVLNELTHECPWIKVSSTLSPIPSFAAQIHNWVQGKTPQPYSTNFDAVVQRHAESIMALATAHGLDVTLSEKAQLQELLKQQTVTEDEALSAILSELALVYLISPNQYGKLNDPVAMFHLSNGARLERVNLRADMSTHGMASSYGVMVNYLYDLNDVEAFHEAFVSRGKVMMSDALWKKARQLSVLHNKD